MKGTELRIDLDPKTNKKTTWNVVRRLISFMSKKKVISAPCSKRKHLHIHASTDRFCIRNKYHHKLLTDHYYSRNGRIRTTVFSEKMS